MKLLRRLSAGLNLLLLIGLIVYVALVPLPGRAPDTAPALVPLTEQIDHILVEKSARRLTVFRNGLPVRNYIIALGFSPVGTKARQGDGRTPEGIFRIDRRNAASAYHLSLGIDYPQSGHMQTAVQAGFNPGGDIFLHGQPNQLHSLVTLKGDWTAGCIALSNADIEELWRITPIGTTVQITP